MENNELPSTAHGVDATSRPSLGFPLGTAVLLVVIFSLSGIFSCCYHWDKLRSYRRSLATSAAADSHHLDPKLSPSSPNTEKEQRQSLPVVMPGDRIPKFIALPCPCEPHRTENIAVEVQKPPMPPRFPVPLC